MSSRPLENRLMRQDLAIAQRLARLVQAIDEHFEAQGAELARIVEELQDNLQQPLDADAFEPATERPPEWSWNVYGSPEEWQCERDRMIELIEREREQLSAAWDRLEDEQRRLMMGQRTTPTLAKGSELPSRHPDIPAPTTPPGDTEGAVRATESTADAIRQRLVRQAAAERPAADQFKQLRLEMDRRNRKP